MVGPICFCCSRRECFRGACTLISSTVLVEPQGNISPCEHDHCLEALGAARICGQRAALMWSVFAVAIWARGSLRLKAVGLVLPYATTLAYSRGLLDSGDVEWSDVVV